MRNSGTIEIIRNTRNTRTSLATRTKSLLSIGMRLIITTRVSNRFHPFRKNARLFGSAINRMLIFLAEISIRFIADPNKRAFFRNGWNLFDTLVVMISLIPIDNSDLVLVARLVRVFRVLRMISIVPELRMLLASLLKALPQLGYVILLMFIIFYIYAAIGATLFESINPVLWGDIAISMLTLFRVMTFEDWTDVMYETMAVYPFSWIYYLSFIFFTAFAFLNMVIGIVVNVMNAENEKLLQAQKEEQHEPTINNVYEKLAHLERLMELQAGQESDLESSKRR